MVAQVPSGKVTTYGKVAKALGDIVASRYVGVAMSLNNDIVRVPCRRVVRSDGSIGGYTGGGPEKKIRLLRKEGVEVLDGKVVDFEHILFKEFRARYPLRELRERQRRMKSKLVVKDPKGIFERVAGIDVAYADDHAHAAIVVFDIASGDEVESRVVEGDATFPYIPTYLAFREIPVIAPLMGHVDDRTVVMIDGNGVLHPEGFGIASQVGVAFGVSTIGIAKKLLCGSLSGRGSKGSRKVMLDGIPAGAAMTARGASSPVFVSVGHGVSQLTAEAIASDFLRFRVPEPTRRAHIVAEAARRNS